MMKKRIKVRDFFSVFSPEQVREVDARIIKAQKEQNARERRAIEKAKDFIFGPK